MTDAGLLKNAIFEGARSALSIFGWWASWTIYDMGKEKLGGIVHRTLLPKGTTASRLPHDRLDLAFELFLSSKARTEFIPPTDWSQGLPDVELRDGLKTYGHEFEVLRSITGLLSETPIVWDIKNEFWHAHLTSSQVMLASGSSNRASRVVIGTPKKPTFSPKLGESRPHLAYSIGIGGGQLKRFQYNEEIERKRLAICNEEGKKIVQAEGSNGWQVDDYLLVTRVPGPTPSTMLTVLSGLHGPGTRSSELLLNAISPRDLEDLASRIGHKRGHVPCFQAVFRASRLKEVDGSSVATHIELVTEGCPPARIAG